MNSAEILRILYRERREWQYSGLGPEISWVVRGLDIALRLIHARAKEERSNALKRRPRLSRWIAGDLYNAINQALAYLAQGKRTAAIETLQAAKAAAEASKANKSPDLGIS